MASTLQLDATWDLVLDSNGNMALLTEAQGALAQDAASAIQTWLGEFFWDVTQGVPWLQQLLAVTPPPLALLRQWCVDAALSVPDVASAQVFFTAVSQRGVSGQVQVVSATGTPPGPQAAAFAVASPQGGG